MKRGKVGKEEEKGEKRGLEGKNRRTEKMRGEHWEGRGIEYRRV